MSPGGFPMDPHDDNLCEVHRWLGLKRHEQPPPGYFERLPDRVLNRIQALPPASRATWLDFLLGRSQLRPAAFGLFTLAVGGLYYFGLTFSDRWIAASASEPPHALAPDPWSITPRVAAWSMPTAPAFARFAAPSSVAPVLDTPQPYAFAVPASASLPSRVQPVSYSVWAR
jgi:hypothetical protein